MRDLASERVLSRRTAPTHLIHCNRMRPKSWPDNALSASGWWDSSLGCGPERTVKGWLEMANAPSVSRPNCQMLSRKSPSHSYRRHRSRGHKSSDLREMLHASGYLVRSGAVGGATHRLSTATGCSSVAPRGLERRPLLRTTPTLRRHSTGITSPPPRCGRP